MSQHPGSIDRHGNQWRVRLSVGGSRHRFYLDGETPLEDVEERIRQQLESERSNAAVETLTQELEKKYPATYAAGFEPAETDVDTTTGETEPPAENGEDTGTGDDTATTEETTTDQ